MVYYLFVPEKLSTPGLSLTFDSSVVLIFTPNSKLVTLWVNCTSYRQVYRPLTSRAHQACSAIKLVLQDWTLLTALTVCTPLPLGAHLEISVPKLYINQVYTHAFANKSGSSCICCVTVLFVLALKTASLTTHNNISRRRQGQNFQTQGNLKCSNLSLISN